VFNPEASDERCSAAVLVDVDPVALGRDRNPVGRFALGHYVNDRPYVTSSYLSVALGRLFGTAMTGRSKERQDVADQAIALEASLPVVARRGGEGLARRLFEPLGYATQTRRCRWTRNSLAGATALTCRCGSRRRSGCATCCATCSCRCRCWTTTSTTGSVPTR
jgi:RNA repair, ligase-Pnkp-associating, region of Hen1